MGSGNGWRVRTPAGPWTSFSPYSTRWEALREPCAGPCPRSIRAEARQSFLGDILGRPSAFEYDGVPGYIHKMPKPTRLALEMALHEEQERRALEGELWRLERAWHEAEEIAAIADNLLLPKGAAELLDERSGRRKAPWRL